MEDTKVLLEITRSKERESFAGIMDSSIQDSGFKEKDMELDYGLLLNEIHILDNGSMESYKDKEFTKPKEDKDMKELSKIS